MKKCYDRAKVNAQCRGDKNVKSHVTKSQMVFLVQSRMSYENNKLMLQGKIIVRNTDNRKGQWCKEREQNNGRILVY
jgi:hypothetical protein